MRLLSCRIFLLATVFFLQSAQAGDITLKLRDVPLCDFAYLVFNDINKHSFIFDNDFLNSQEFITVNLFDVESKDVLDYLKLSLSENGYSFTEINGLYHVSKTKQKSDDAEFFVYRPVYRSADYLRELAGIVFGTRGFSTTRQVSDSGGYDAISVKDEGLNTLVSRKGVDTIVYQGAFKDVQKLKKLLVELDQPSGEVLVKAVVYEVRNDATESNAISLALGLIKSTSGLGVQIDTGVADGNNAIKIQSSNVQALWSALSGDSRFKLVSSPTIRIKSGDQARFMAGEEVPTLGAVTYQDGNSIQSVDYRSAGIILELKPEIREQVTDLTITQQISSFIPTTTGVNSSPTLLKRELQTTVTVAGDEVIILGGLDEKTDSKSEEGLFFLPAWLRGSRSDSNKTEIMMMLHVQRI